MFKTLAVLVLLLSSAAAQTSGVLVGFSTFDEKRGGGEAPKPPSFHTLWITHTGGKPQLTDSLDVLLVPTDEGWKRMGSISYCTDYCDSGYYEMQDLYLVAPHEGAQLRPTDSARCRHFLSSKKLSKADADYTLSAFTSDRVFWVSPSYVSHLTDSSEFEPCEVRGGRERTEPIVSELGHDLTGRIDYDQVPGNAGADALTKAFTMARAAAITKGEECPKDLEMKDLSGWYIKRKPGAWGAFVYEWIAGADCLMEAEIEAPLAQNFVGNDKLAIPYERLRKIYPGLLDAFSSPLGDMIVLKFAGELRAFELKDGELAKEFSTIPLPDAKADTVMIQWALNRFVARWTAEIKQMKAAGFPKPIVK